MDGEKDILPFDVEIDFSALKDETKNIRAGFKVKNKYGYIREVSFGMMKGLEKLFQGGQLTVVDWWTVPVAPPYDEDSIDKGVRDYFQEKGKLRHDIK